MGWEQLKIQNGKSYLFCNAYITSKTAMNVIVTHTPIVTTLEMQPAYQPLEKYHINVFAFDFSGTGKSGGIEADFSRKSIMSDLDAVVDYIENNFSSNIHLYGNTGIGGMFAQCYAAKSIRIKSFAQFACVHYKNTAGLGYPYILAKILCFVLKMLPNFRFVMKPPKYRGYHHEKDDALYKKLEADNPAGLKTGSKMLQALLECFVSNDSEVRNSVTIPTLVFKVLHDRYFSRQYFDDYFNSLNGKKRLIEVDDVHNSYYLESDLFCKSAYEWFAEHAGQS